LLYRSPGKTAIDPASGDMYTDLLVIQVSDDMTKLTLVQDPQSPFFTIGHFNGYNALLVPTG
jgi:hypothetical protein